MMTLEIGAHGEVTTNGDRIRGGHDPPNGNRTPTGGRRSRRRNRRTPSRPRKKMRRETWPMRSQPSFNRRPPTQSLTIKPNSNTKNPFLSLSLLRLKKNFPRSLSLLLLKKLFALRPKTPPPSLPRELGAKNNAPVEEQCASPPFTVKETTQTIRTRSAAPAGKGPIVADNSYTQLMALQHLATQGAPLTREGRLVR